MRANARPHLRSLPRGEGEAREPLRIIHRSVTIPGAENANFLPVNRAAVGQPSWLPVLRASLPAEHLGSRGAARTGRLEACPT